MNCGYGYNFVGDKLVRKHWTMKEMMKKYKDTLISSALITLIGAMVGITSIKDKWINVFFVVAYYMAYTYYDIAI